MIRMVEFLGIMLGCLGFMALLAEQPSLGSLLVAVACAGLAVLVLRVLLPLVQRRHDIAKVVAW